MAADNGKIQAVYDLVDRQGISYEAKMHDAVFTVDEVLALPLPDVHLIAKNLFVRDRNKTNYYLLVVRQDQKIDLKRVREYLGSSRLTLASEADLGAILGLAKGSVTPFGVINDVKRQVKVYFDASFEHGRIGVHPNENTATVWLACDDLLELIRERGNIVRYVRF